MATFQFGTGSTGSIPIGYSAAWTHIRQSFVPSSNRKIQSVSVSGKRYGSPTDNTVVRIETDNGSGAPSGTLVSAGATGSVVSTTWGTGSYTMEEVALDSEVSVVSGTKYHIVFSRDGAVSSSNYINVINDNTFSLAGSNYQAYYGNYTTWNFLTSIGYTMEYEYTQTLVDDWEFYHKYDTSNTTQPDATGNGNTGAVSGATYNASGKLNGCYSFDGSNDVIVVNSSDSLFSTPTSQTIVIWFNNDTTGLRHMYTSRGAEGQIGVRFNAGNLDAYGYDTTGSTIISTAFSDTGNWHLIVVTVEYGNEMCLYLDNVLKGAVSIGSGKALGTVKGCDIGQNTGNNRFYDGLLDEVGVAAKVLTGRPASVGSSATGEIAEIWNSGDGTQYPFSTTPTTAKKTSLSFGAGF